MSPGQRPRHLPYLVFLLDKARARLAQGRGLPRMTELRALLRQAREDHKVLRPAPVAGRFSKPPWDPYDAWLSVNRWTTAAADDLRERLGHAGRCPRISIVTPVFRPDLAAFRQTAESVLAQVSSGWEWCLADDASGDAALTALLAELAQRDSRVCVTTRPDNGHISRATNSAAALATGEFLAFLDHDDLLTPDAVGEVALHLARHPDIDVLYSDDDKIDLDGRRYDPQFKPDWSPEALLSRMYLGHLLVVRRTLFEAIGGFRAGFEGSQDHDLALRATERARSVGHLPLVLYHWRASPGSVATNGSEKPYAFDAGKRAIEEALSRRGVPCAAERPEWAIRANVGVFRHQFPDTGPTVAVLIATRNNHRVLARCLASLAATTYRNVEVIVLDDCSDDPETRDYLASLGCRVLRPAGERREFNYAALHNWAVRQVPAEFVLFLNDDTEVCNPSWLSQMMGFARLPGVGAVGARLLFPDQTIQHAGIIHGVNQHFIGIAFRGLPASDPGYLFAARSSGNYGAVTAACLLTPRELFLTLGGFDEVAFAVSFNDVDYGYRLAQMGYRSVYAPEVELLHDEGTSRGLQSAPGEIARIRARYRLRRDPYFNSNLSTDSERFQVRPTRIARRAPRPIRTLLVSHALDLTGAPLYLLELTTGLAQRGILDPTIVASAEGPLLKRFAEGGLPVHIVPAGELMDAATFGRRIASMRTELVFANTLRMFFAVDAARRVGVPSVWTIHESEPWRSCYSDLPEPLQRTALACFSAPYRVVFVSDASRALFEPLNSAHNFEVIHVGLPPDRLPAPTGAARDRARGALAIDSDDIVIVLVGTVCERKGQHDLVEALRRMPAAVLSHVRCFIVGDRPGPYSDELKRLVSALPELVRSRVCVVPETTDVAKYLHAADLFACTSRVESYPRVTLEAMSACLPIVSTPVFGLREQLRENINARFYKPGDTRTLARELTRLIGNTEMRAEMGRASSEVLAGLLSFDEMIDAYARVVREAAESSSASDNSIATCRLERRYIEKRVWQ